MSENPRGSSRCRGIGLAILALSCAGPLAAEARASSPGRPAAAARPALRAQRRANGSAGALSVRHPRRRRVPDAERDRPEPATARTGRASREERGGSASHSRRQSESPSRRARPSPRTNELFHRQRSEEVAHERALVRAGEVLGRVSRDRPGGLRERREPRVRLPGRAGRGSRADRDVRRGSRPGRPRRGRRSRASHGPRRDSAVRSAHLSTGRRRERTRSRAAT